MQVEIAYEFGFDAAHFFRHEPVGHPYRQLHGHSFTAELVIAGEPDAATGFVVDFAELERAGAELRAQLDHVLLNDVPGLEVPSLENITGWLWAKLRPKFPGLRRVIVRRPSCRQTCTYLGEEPSTEDRR